MSPHTFAPRSAKARQTGFSLIELLVAMAMGIAMMAVVLLSYQGMTSSSRLSTAQQQMTEDAQAAFQLLGQQIRTAGFNPPQPRVATPWRNRLSASPLLAGESELGLFGCQNGFANATAAAGPPVATEIRLLTCNPVAAGPNNASFAVQYEADAFSPNVALAAGVTTPADCRGFAVPTLQQQTAIGAAVQPLVPYTIVENRYYISPPTANNPNPGLSCVGNGGAVPFSPPPQPLVGNIESMQIDYGVASLNPLTGATSTFVAGYLTANQIGLPAGLPVGGEDATFSIPVVPAVTLPPTPAAVILGSQRWGLVKTVRVCLVVKSESTVLVDNLIADPNLPPVYGYYLPCNPVDNTPVAITDRFLRKSFVMHFSVRNRT
jgi:type IV pilus assembly protein PilW